MEARVVHLRERWGNSWIIIGQSHFLSEESNSKSSRWVSLRKGLKKSHLGSFGITPPPTKNQLPSGKLWHNYGKSQFFMGKPTISDYFQWQTVSLPEGDSCDSVMRSSTFVAGLPRHWEKARAWLPSSSHISLDPWSKFSWGWMNQTFREPSFENLKISLTGIDENWGRATKHPLATQYDHHSSDWSPSESWIICSPKRPPASSIQNRSLGQKKPCRSAKIWVEHEPCKIIFIWV